MLRGKGAPDAEAMVVSQRPGHHEDEQGAVRRPRHALA
jgi:hypothetical protein